jgi:hypothetical protein
MKLKIRSSEIKAYDLIKVVVYAVDNVRRITVCGEEMADIRR